MNRQTPDAISPVLWQEDHLKLLDQRNLPAEHHYLSYRDVETLAQAITDMVVRGAPAIGIAAAYGVVLAARSRFAESNSGWKDAIGTDLERLAKARPTAVNLFWAIERMSRVIESLNSDDPEPALLREAHAILDEDIAANRKMGELGCALIEESCNVLTHCNAGALATGGYGTALGVIRSAFAASKVVRVYADETRPWMQGSRLTAWEMVQEGIPVTVITEGAAASLMRSGEITWIIVGSDRIAGNGDVANKIGTYSLAVNARHHGVKFMVVAPSSTVDMSLTSGDQIPIEQRSPDEILCVAGSRFAAPGADALNPAFDVTPADLVDAIVTERGVVLQPNAERMAEMMKNKAI